MFCRATNPVTHTQQLCMHWLSTYPGFTLGSLEVQLRVVCVALTRKNLVRNWVSLHLARTYQTFLSLYAQVLFVWRCTVFKCASPSAHPSHDQAVNSMCARAVFCL